MSDHRRSGGTRPGSVKRAAAVAIFSLACASGIAASPSTSLEVVTSRQASMKDMAAAIRTIAGMFGGKLAYDPTTFKAAADTIRARTGAALIAEFPSGTLGPPSGAKLNIDQERSEFEALARHFGTLADVLAVDAARAPPTITSDMRMGPGMVTGGGSLLGKRPGVAEIAPAKLPAEHVLHLILQDCSSCHAKFRERTR
ncbi:cytochrome c (plasmid) [Mesorhizobium sp. INR15]|nr:cytochrome c [Mesorhizobium sp. INR15]